MEANKSKYLALSLGVLIMFSAALFFLTREDERPEIDQNYFAIGDTEEINHIRLTSSTDTVDLAFDGSQWRVNGKWQADIQMIKVLMATLRQAVPHRPVALAQKDTVKKQLARTGTRVFIEEGEGPPISFMAGGSVNKNESWFLKEGDDQPYVMIIPGYRVYVAGILQMDASGWRNKRIFDFNWRNFKTLTSTYPQEPAAGFSIEMKQRYFGIVGMQQVDTTKLNDYLDAVSLLMAKRFLDSKLPGVEQLLTKTPLARVEIKDIADRTYSLELFLPEDADRVVYGRTSDGQIVAFEREEISSIVRRRTYFVSQNDH